MTIKPDLTILSRAELLSRKQQLDSEVISIKMQLDQVRLTLVQTGQFADRTWYTRATHAMRLKGMESQAIQLELSRRKGVKKNERPDTLESRFMHIARQRLSNDVFSDILGEAQELTTQTE